MRTPRILNRCPPLYSTAPAATPTPTTTPPPTPTPTTPAPGDDPLDDPFGEGFLDSPRVVTATAVGAAHETTLQRWLRAAPRLALQDKAPLKLP